MVNSNQFSMGEKPKVGRLWYNGKVIIANKPFRYIQWRKKILIANGYQKDLFKITY